MSICFDEILGTICNKICGCYLCRMYIAPDIILGYNISGGDYMPVSKANQRAVAKYMKANYDDIKVRTPKGKRKLIQEHAKSHGESANEFINRAINETMERDGANT